MAGPLIPVGGADIVGVGLYRLSKDRPNTFVATWYSTNADKPLGEVRELLWTHQGKPCFKGVGIEIGDQLIVSYWRVPGSES
jgi:hypothetical protein